MPEKQHALASLPRRQAPRPSRISTSPKSLWAFVGVVLLSATAAPRSVPSGYDDDLSSNYTDKVGVSATIGMQNMNRANDRLPQPVISQLIQWKFRRRFDPDEDYLLVVQMNVDAPYAAKQGEESKPSTKSGTDEPETSFIRAMTDLMSNVDDYKARVAKGAAEKRGEQRAKTQSG
ncbi:hypothetical protein GN244_ATG15234 [Phytophthora infestans]|uniref:Uncharacterized protein n=1 Tax=Phytophthora infestans TaxID=4787 RepID=A0A833WPC3_PHYIN|nr:hypothetical protein GN244_ATG15234 [Phytophthora infestans]